MDKKKGLIVLLTIIVIGSVIALIAYMTLNKNPDSDNEVSDTSNTTQNGEVPSSTNPTIPKDFKTVDTKEGTVIEDNDGNQFVWIPVDGENIKLSRRTFLNGKMTEAALNETIDRIYYGEESTFACIYKYKKQEDKYQYCIDAFKESVEKYRRLLCVKI